jgi:hypothetical protein
MEALNANDVRPGPETDRRALVYLAAGAALFVGMLGAAAWMSRDLDRRAAPARAEELATGQPLGAERPTLAPARPPKPEALRRFVLYATPVYVAFLVAGALVWRRIDRVMAARNAADGPAPDAAEGPKAPSADPAREDAR